MVNKVKIAEKEEKLLKIQNGGKNEMKNKGKSKEAQKRRRRAKRNKEIFKREELKKIKNRRSRNYGVCPICKIGLTSTKERKEYVSSSGAVYKLKARCLCCGYEKISFRNYGRCGIVRQEMFRRTGYSGIVRIITINNDPATAVISSLNSRGGVLP